MTDIATKNGAVIFKDGAAAENCNCCNNVCTELPRTIRLEVTGMPDFGTYVARSTRRTSEDNGGSYTLFRRNNTSFVGWSGVCAWWGRHHGYVNPWGVFGHDDYDAYWTYRPDIEELWFGQNFGALRFGPPPGKSFKQLPFEHDEPLRVIYGPYPGVSYDGLRVRISKGTGDYIPKQCPPAADCTSADTLQAINGVQPSIPLSCPTTTDKSKFYNIPDLPLNITITGPGVPWYTSPSGAPTVSFGYLSGEYDLRWQENPYPKPFLGSQYAGDMYLIGQGYGLIAWIPAGAPPTGQKRFDVGIYITVKPVLSKFQHDNYNIQSFSPCPGGQTSWVVICYMVIGAGGSASVVKSLDCLTACSAPSFSFEETVPVVFPGAGNPAFFTPPTDPKITVRIATA